MGSAWTVERPAGTGPALLEVAALPDGGALAVGEAGVILRRDAAGSWSEEDVVGSALTGLCVTSAGALAVGEGALVRIPTAAEAPFEVLPAIDDFGGYWGGDAWMNGVACRADGHAVAGGYWSGAASADLGDTWAAADVESAWGYLGQVSALEVSAAGTWVGVGYYYLGRSEDGVTFEAPRLSWPVDWLTDVAAGPEGVWWASGDAGTVRRSEDDGWTWQDASPPMIDSDLYALAFRGDGVGLAVGAAGAAALTRDGGETWEDVSLDSEIMLAGVSWQEDGSALVVGGGGLVLRLMP